MTSYQESISDFKQVLSQADHWDTRFHTCSKTLEEYVASLLSFQPWWLRVLLKLRTWALNLLGVDDAALKIPLDVDSAQLPLAAGDSLDFFAVHAAKKGSHWIAYAEEKHIVAYLAVVRERVSNGQHRFHVSSLLRYKNPLGRFYFVVVAPFHYFLMHSLSRHASRPPKL